MAKAEYFIPTEHPHRRLNPLTGEWILVSPHRAKRPWQGQVEKVTSEDRLRYDPDCYLCPGNTRSSGKQNPPYDHTFVFTNDFSALLQDKPELPDEQTDTLLRTEPVGGTCRVVCFSPRHDLSLPEMDVKEIRLVVDTWVEQTIDLGKSYCWVQVFENKGAVMGSSMPHPHGQIWAMDSLPNEPYKEDCYQREYFHQNKSLLLLDYLDLESQYRERIVVENENWLVVVPYWAVWPFETLLMPKQPISQLQDLTNANRNTLAEILKRLLIKYDNLFETSFPYSMGWHGAPFMESVPSPVEYWQLHAHFYPPLLRSATVKKFMVGFEMMAEAQRDLTAEQAAARLRDLPEIHYKKNP
jgi:UDPglucose--hexose-1-phosphate uridylyltransferase